MIHFAGRRRIKKKITEMANSDKTVPRDHCRWFGENFTPNAQSCNPSTWSQLILHFCRLDHCQNYCLNCGNCNPKGQLLCPRCPAFNISERLSRLAKTLKANP